MSSELLRIVDVLSRDKNIDREVVFADLELALGTAVRKAHAPDDDVSVTIDRHTGQLRAERFGRPLDPTTLGRIAAQAAKQVLLQRLRDAERLALEAEYRPRIGELLTGTVQRYESGNLIIALPRTDALLPRSEQLPGETHQPGDRIRALLTDVRNTPHGLRLILSRTHPDLIRRLFASEVPEIADRIIEIRALSREPGYRTKVAVSSIDSRVDAVGACVGVRGTRIKAIVDELGGEKIDIVRWNESSQILVSNALRPAEITEIALCFELGRVTVVVNEDQLSLAIGKRGQNVRLAARLTGWDIDILTPAEYNKGLDDLEKTLLAVDGVDPVFVNKLVAMGVISVMDVEEVGTEPLVKELEVTPELAGRMVAAASEAAKRISAEMEAEKARRAAEQKAESEKEGAAEPVTDEASGASGEGETTGASEEGETTGASEESETTDASEEGETTDASEEGETTDASEEGKTAGTVVNGAKEEVAGGSGESAAEVRL